MKVAIVVVTQDAHVRAFFDDQKGSVVPKELRKNNTQYSVVPVDATCSDVELFKILLDAHGKHDAVGVLVETGREARLNDCFSALFLKTFSPIEAKNSMKNYFGHSLTRWLKNLLFVSRAFADGKQRKCLLLPYTNFSADELSEVIQLCRLKSDEGEFQELLERQLKAIRERSIPKKKKSGSQHFLKDDSQRYFELAKEKHGQSETSIPPHSPYCKLTASARFGITVDRDLHYNVSLEAGQISGDFKDCHSADVQIKPRKHINMFPNGFIR